MVFVYSVSVSAAQSLAESAVSSIIHNTADTRGLSVYGKAC